VFVILPPYLNFWAKEKGKLGLSGLSDFLQIILKGKSPSIYRDKKWAKVTPLAPNVYKIFTIKIEKFPPTSGQLVHKWGSDFVKKKASSL